MRHILILLAALGLLPGGQPEVAPPSRAGGGPPHWAPDVRAASAYAAGRVGTVSFAVRTREHLWGRRPRMGVSSASVVKAMLLVAYLDHPAVRGRRLTAGERALLGPMIRYSDNDAATRVRALVGDARILRLARQARMRRFRLSPSWGLSRIDAADQSRYFLSLPELTARRHRAYALGLLGSIVPEQRWGVGRTRPRGWRLYFKGGWGAGSGAVSHQVALLRHGRRRVAVAITTTGSPSHAYSEATLEGVARRLLRGLERPRPQARRRSAPVRGFRSRSCHRP